MTTKTFNPLDSTPVIRNIPKVETKLSLNDYWGNLKVRFAFRRHTYLVKPGLYAVGKPINSSDVYVTANYKLSFDILRKNLHGFNAWILVLDTKGINVWCAAGKGTFGTKELVNKVNETGLKDIVSHRKLIVPQLGAPGIAAHLVKQLCGFTVIYGPVRASDIKGFVENGYKSTIEMRTVRFPLADRLKLIPVEVIIYAKYLTIAITILLLISGISKEGYSFNTVLQESSKIISLTIISYLCGIVITPILLPYIPFRSFSSKGAAIGLLVLSMLSLLRVNMGGNMETVSWYMIGIAAASFLAMNFTGTSTFTSLSGVKKEMKYAIPLQIAFAASGLLLFLTAKLI